MTDKSKTYGVCPLCGSYGPQTAHHLRSDPELKGLKINVCRECHDILEKYEDEVITLREHLEGSTPLKARTLSVPITKERPRVGKALDLRIGQTLMVNHLTLKVERENAKAMIEGFDKGKDHHFVTIFTAHRDAWSIANDLHDVPKLLSAKRSPPRAEYPLSYIGKALNGNSYSHKAKYVAVLDRIFHIKNDYGMWEKLCSNGVFDIWNPRAPHNSLKDKKDPMILALRIFETDKDLSQRIEGKYYYDKVRPTRVKLVRPIIDNSQFEAILGKVREAGGTKVLDEERVTDTTRIG